jgi:hypothetical protein
MEEFNKGSLYTEEDLKKTGLYFYKRLSSKLCIYKIEKKTFYFYEITEFEDPENAGKLKYVMKD